MQPSPIFLAALLSTISSVAAVSVCSEYDPFVGGCTGNCTPYTINVGEVIETPGTQCIYNSDSNGAFDLTICSGSNLSGTYNDLKSIPSKIIGGQYNWHTPGTGSIKRTS
jgi:hypothetical protein